MKHHIGNSHLDGFIDSRTIDRAIYLVSSYEEIKLIVSFRLSKLCV